MSHERMFRKGKPGKVTVREVLLLCVSRQDRKWFAAGESSWLYHPDCSQKRLNPFVLPADFPATVSLNKYLSGRFLDLRNKFLRDLYQLPKENSCCWLKRGAGGKGFSQKGNSWSLTSCLISYDLLLPLLHFSFCCKVESSSPFIRAIIFGCFETTSGASFTHSFVSDQQGAKECWLNSNNVRSL